MILNIVKIFFNMPVIVNINCYPPHSPLMRSWHTVTSTDFEYQEAQISLASGNDYFVNRLNLVIAQMVYQHHTA